MYERMESSGNSAAMSCYRCSKRCGGFLTDREQRKVWGVGVLYLLGFPILCCMIIVGALKVDKSRNFRSSSCCYMVTKQLIIL